MQIAIIDDDRGQIEYLSALAAEWAKGAGEAARLCAFESAEEFLFAYSEDRSFDILLLDVEMGKMDGVALAKEIRKDNRTVQIIFVTGYYEYIGDGYDVSALHYLLKPATPEKLFPVLNRAAENLRYRQKALVAADGGQTVRIPLADIVYLEAARNYVEIHSAEGVCRIKSTLAGIEQELDGTFFKCRRSFVAGLRYVRKVTKTAVFLAERPGAPPVEIPLARGLYDALNRALMSRL